MTVQKSHEHALNLFLSTILEAPDKRSPILPLQDLLGCLMSSFWRDALEEELHLFTTTKDFLGGVVVMSAITSPLLYLGRVDIGVYLFWSIPFSINGFKCSDLC